MNSSLLTLEIHQSRNDRSRQTANLVIWAPWNINSNSYDKAIRVNCEITKDERDKISIRPYSYEFGKNTANQQDKSINNLPPATQDS